MAVLVFFAAATGARLVSAYLLFVADHCLRLGLTAHALRRCPGGTLFGRPVGFDLAEVGTLLARLLQGAPIGKDEGAS